MIYLFQQPVVPEKSLEQMEEEAQKEYEAYLAMEKVILKDMGLAED